MPHVPADRSDRGPRAVGDAAPPAGDVRVQPRDGQQQRDPGRVLGRDRVDAGAPGRLHLGVARPWPRATAPGRDHPPCLRRRLRRHAKRRRVLHRRHHVPGPEPEAGHLRTHVPRLPRPGGVGRGGDRGRARGPGQAREPGRVPRHRVAPRGVGGHGGRRAGRLRGPAVARDRAGRIRRGLDPGLPAAGCRGRRALADAALPDGRGGRLGGGRPRDRLGAGAAGRRGSGRSSRRQRGCTRHDRRRTTSGLDRRRRARRRGVPPPLLVCGAAGPVPLARADGQRPDRRDGWPLGGLGPAVAHAPARRGRAGRRGSNRPRDLDHRDRPRDRPQPAVGARRRWPDPRRRDGRGAARDRRPRARRHGPRARAGPRGVRVVRARPARDLPGPGPGRAGRPVAFVRRRPARAPTCARRRTAATPTRAGSASPVRTTGSVSTSTVLARSRPPIPAPPTSTTATHDVELRPRAETIVHIDAAHRGVGTASCGPDTIAPYVMGGGTYRWAWTLRAEGAGG